MATIIDRAKLDTGALNIKPMTPAIGAEILDIDLGADTVAERIPDIRAALLKYGVIFFRDQALTQEQHIAFARHFGDLEVHPATPKDQPNPEVLRIAYGPDRRGQENNWHSDVTWREEPSLGSILLAREVPEVGGDTLFANMHLAYERLSPQMKRFCEGLTAVHDIARVFAKRLGKQPEELHDKYPPRAPSGDPHPSRDGREINLRQRRLRQPYRRSIRGRKSVVARPFVCNRARCRNPMPVPLGSGIDRLLGQPRVPTFGRVGLFPRTPGDGTRHNRRRQAVFQAMMLAQFKRKFTG